MRFIRGTGLFLAALVVLIRPAPGGAALRVMASVPDLAAIAKAIGRDHAVVASMALSTQDPHFVDARPHLALELSKADLLLVVGLDLEVGWLPVLIAGSRNPRIQRGGPGYMDASTLVERRDVLTGKVDRSMGDIHPAGNPHYLLDPREVLKVARGIAAKMIALDSSHEKDYRNGLAVFEDDLARVRASAESQLASLRGAKAITYHRSLTYLADWLGLKVVDTIEPKPGISPNPSHVASVLKRIREENVKLILHENYYPNTIGKLLSEKSGAVFVELHGGTDFIHGETYPQHLAEIAAALAATAKPSTP